MFETFNSEQKKNTKITKLTCISRQKIMHNEKKMTGHRRTQFNDIFNVCHGCLKGIEFYNKKLKGDKMEKKSTKNDDQNDDRKMCEVCGFVKPLTKGFFMKAKFSKDGFKGTCTACLRLNDADGTKMHISDESIVIPGIIKIDLQKEPELMNKIEKWSVKNRRSPSDQILWNIEEFLSNTEMETHNAKSNTE